MKKNIVRIPVSSLLIDGRPIAYGILTPEKQATLLRLHGSERLEVLEDVY